MSGEIISGGVGLRNLAKEGPLIGKGNEEVRNTTVEEKENPNLDLTIETDTINPKVACENDTIGCIVETYSDEADIPEELLGRQFTGIDVLNDELEILGLQDSKFFLNEDGFVTRPDPNHNYGTRYIERKLSHYCKGWLGEWGVCSGDNVQEINRTTRTGRTAKREPEFNFWNYKKCTKSDGDMEVKSRDGSLFELDPDVFFQFSWGNSPTREFAAMDELLGLGGVGAGNAGPTVGFLIKVRKSGGNNVGLDVYKVYNGFTIDDAIAGTNDCEHLYYNASGKQDVSIVITPSDFGFTGVQALFLRNFKLSMARLWRKAKLG
jgi:hypothetical protein